MAATLLLGISTPSKTSLNKIEKLERRVSLKPEEAAIVQKCRSSRRAYHIARHMVKAYHIARHMVKAYHIARHMVKAGHEPRNKHGESSPFKENTERPTGLGNRE
jgi:hypothetical protein